MATPTVQSGKLAGEGYRTYFYRDAKGNYLPCQVLSGPAGGPFTIRIPSRLHLSAAQHTLSGIPLATSKASTNAVHPRVRS
jgi:hypothetical protein